MLQNVFFRLISFFCGLAYFFQSCTKDRVSITNPPSTLDSIFPGVIKINEFLAKGDAYLSDLGESSDWLELYNTTNQEILLKEGEWFVTDDAGSNDEKFKLPEIKIGPFGHLLIWCDGKNTFTGMVHTNFSLSSQGENIGIFYKNASGKIEIDRKPYGPQTIDNISIGRSPDGSENWVEFNNPTPGAPNP